MSRTILWILTIFLSIAMIALVGVQAYWFKNSIEAKEQQLGMVVKEVITEFSDELLSNQTLTTILEEIQPPVVHHQSSAVWNYRIDHRSTIGEDGLLRKETQVSEEGRLVYKQPDPSILNQKIKIIDDSVIVVIGQDEKREDTILSQP